MAKVTYKAKDLKKMSLKDLRELENKLLAELAHTSLRIQSKEDKQSHKVNALKKSVARIKTFTVASQVTNQTANDEK